MKKKTNVSVGKVVAVSAGVIALGSVAYYLFGKDSKEHQKKAKVLLEKVKAEVQKDVKKGKKIVSKVKKVVKKIK